MGKRKKSKSNSRYTNFSSSGGSSGNRINFWIMIWIVWLVLFLALIPQIMCNGDTGCASVPSTNLLYLWWFVLTLGGAVPYLDTIFGIWAFLLVVGFLDSMS